MWNADCSDRRKLDPSGQARRVLHPKLLQLQLSKLVIWFLHLTTSCPASVNASTGQALKQGAEQLVQGFS